MLTSGLFTTHSFKVNHKHEGKPFRLVIFGDVHRDSPNHADGHWKSFLSHARKLKDAIFLGMGDYVDSASTSERECLARTAFHESTKNDIEHLAHEKVKLLAGELDFMRGRLVGLVNGNHYFQFQDGTNTDQKLCGKLACKYLGVCSFIRLYIDVHKKVLSLDLFVHHGKGAARLVGGSLNRVAQMVEGAEADIFCVDDATEILTERGWLGREALTDADVVACFNPLTSLVEWHKPTNRVEFNYVGDAIQIKNANINSIVHPKHRVIYKYKNGWLFKEADEFSRLKVQASIPLAGHSINEVDVSDDELSLCGWILSEGTFDVSGIRLTQKEGRKADKIRELLNRVEPSFTEWARNDGVIQFYISKKRRARYDNLLPNKKSQAPDWLHKCSDRQFEVLLASLTLGDGTNCGPKTSEIYSASEKFIDSLQAACAVHGKRTSKRYKKGGFKDGGWALTITNRDTTQLYLHAGRVTAVPYSGKMWCVTVPTGAFIARRSGKVFVTGNCMGHDHKRGAVPMSPRLFLDHSSHNGLKVRHKEVWAVRSGSFLASYTDGEVNYNVDAGRSPCSLGHVEMLITPSREGIKIQSLV